MPAERRLEINKDLPKDLLSSLGKGGKAMGRGIKGFFWNNSRDFPTVHGFLTVVFGAIGLFVWGIGAAANRISKKSAALEQAQALVQQEKALMQENFQEAVSEWEDTINDAASAEHNGYKYQLVDDHIVAAEHGGIRYDFDFKAKIVTINGDDSADGIRLFHEFQNASLIEECREVGLQIAGDFQCFFEGLPNEEGSWIKGDTAEQQGLQKEMKNIYEVSQAFETTYSAPIPAIK